MSDPSFAPRSLGRGVVVRTIVQIPSPWADAPRVTIDEAALRAPREAVDALHTAWQTRTPVVVVLEVDANDLRQPETEKREPYLLTADFEFRRERLHFLVWANNYDLRSGTAVWWHSENAVRLGAKAGGDADVVLPDGRAAWCDGGPRGPVDVSQAIVHRETIERDLLHTSPAGLSRHADIAELADDQAEAVLHPGGPARIIAPAGSGKTRTLTARLTHLLRDRWIEPAIVTAVAYNARAAQEMRSRTAGLEANVRTIHSLAYAIVRSGNGDLQVVDERTQRSILNPLIPSQPRQNRDQTAPYLEALATVRIGLIRPEIVAEMRDDIPDFPSVFDRYRQGLEQRNAIDFDEQIYQAIRMLLIDPALRRRVQGTARHLLVDEFQDLTPAFLLLLRLVAAPAYQVFGVGDDDQVIYGYTGATPEFLIDFDRLFPGAGHYALETNYRCPEPVVAAAANLLTHKQRRIPKAIKAEPSKKGSLLVERLAEGAMALRAGELITAWFAEGVALKEIAVLSRVNHALLPTQAVLESLGVAHSSPVGPEFLRRTAVRAFRAYLRIGLAPDLISRADLQEVVGRPARRISRAANPIFARRPRWTIDQLQAASASFSAGSQDRFEGFIADLESVVEAASSGDAATVLRTVRSEVGLDRAAALLDGSRSAADRSGHTDDLDALAQLCALHPNAASFETWLEGLLARPASPNGVTLSTIHKVKGMEWPKVIVAPVRQGQMPHRLADDLEEERRVFHVAITRGIDEAVVLGDAAHPSRFLDELFEPPAPPRPQPARQPTQKQGPLPKVGQRLLWSGHRGTISKIVDDGVLVDVGGTSLRVPWNEQVTVNGVSGPLRRPTEAEPEPDHEIVKALKAWRKEQAVTQNVPAYIVLSDKHLRAIAARAPESLEQLAECPGIGPTKLEAYGEAILEVLDPGSASPGPAPGR